MEENEEFFEDTRQSIRKNKCSGFVTAIDGPLFISGSTLKNIQMAMLDELSWLGRPENVIMIVWENSRENIAAALKQIEIYEQKSKKLFQNKKEPDTSAPESSTAHMKQDNKDIPYLRPEDADFARAVLKPLL